MVLSNKNVRPGSLRKSVFKHSMSEGRDCALEWMANFGKMEILIYAPFISSALLIDCLWNMARSDERFQQTGITSPLHMNRFKIILCVEHGDGEAWYNLRVYKLCTGNEKLDQLEIELAATACMDHKSQLLPDKE